MGRSTVRAAIATFLTDANITHLSKVYGQPPKLTEAGEFFDKEDPGHQTGAVIYLHLAGQDEHRLALGGPTGGQKERLFTCALICVLRSKKPDTQEIGDDNDAFLDSLVAAIESSREAGNPSVIFQWGEGSDLYGTDIKVRAEMPRPRRLQGAQVFSVVEVTVIEMLQT